MLNFGCLVFCLLRSFAHQLVLFGEIGTKSFDFPVQLMQQTYDLIQLAIMAAVVLLKLRSHLVQVRCNASEQYGQHPEGESCRDEIPSSWYVERRARE